MMVVSYNLWDFHMDSQPCNNRGLSSGHKATRAQNMVQHVYLLKHIAVVSLHFRRMCNSFVNILALERVACKFSNFKSGVFVPSRPSAIGWFSFCKIDPNKLGSSAQFNIELYTDIGKSQMFTINYLNIAEWPEIFRTQEKYY